MRSWLFGVFAAASLALAQGAEARRTVIDQNPDGTTNPTTLFGYCDLNGDDCTAKSLGYTFTFANGVSVDSLIIYGNGMLSFGSTPVSFGQLTQDGYPNGVDLPISYFGDGVLSASFNNIVTQDFQGGYPNVDVWEQSGDLFIDSASARAHWYTCFSTSFCTGDYYVEIRRVAGGLQVDLSGDPPFARNTGAVIGGTTYGLNQTSYLIRGTFATPTGGVPEPATWAMMILGFGAVSFSLRRRAQILRAPTTV